MPLHSLNRNNHLWKTAEKRAVPLKINTNEQFWASELCNKIGSNKWRCNVSSDSSDFCEKFFHYISITF